MRISGNEPSSTDLWYKHLYLLQVHNKKRTIKVRHFIVWLPTIADRLGSANWSKENKGRDLTDSYDKCPYTNRKFKTVKWQYKTPQKTLIAYQLWTDLRRLVGATTAIQVVWLNQFTGS